MTTKSKIFILDTNVLLHDYKSIYSFEDNDVIIPIVTLEELDRFKKGNDTINYQAREFTRELDKLSGDKFPKNGVALGEKLGKLFIATGKPFSENIKESFAEKSADHRILAIAEHLNKKHKDKKVILVSKDINLRVKAKSLDIMAQDYNNDKIANLDDIYKKISIKEDIDINIIEKLYEHKEGVDISTIDFDPNHSDYCILKNNQSSALIFHDKGAKKICRVEKQYCYGIEPRNAEQTFALDALLRDKIQLVALTGKAGTGKTLLALAAALQHRRNYKQIYLARPIIPLSNKELGFLPGAAGDKIAPYMQPLFDNLSVIKHNFAQTSKEFIAITDMIANEKLVITPLAYIRGRSLSNIFFIVDEAQNLTPLEVKTIITRAGEGTKMIFVGDIEQIDTPYLDEKSNGLAFLTEKMKDQEIFAHVNLVKGERSFLSELASKLL